jgi:hypothetical protein
MSVLYSPTIRATSTQFPESNGTLFFIQPLKMDLTEGSETSAKLNLTPGKHQKVNIQKNIKHIRDFIELS